MWKIQNRRPRCLEIDMINESTQPFESIISKTPFFELPIQKRIQLSRLYELGLNKLVPMLEKKKFIYILDSWLELKGMDEGSEDGQIPFDNSINQSILSNGNGKLKVQVPMLNLDKNRGRPAVFNRQSLEESSPLIQSSENDLFGDIRVKLPQNPTPQGEATVRALKFVKEDTIDQEFKMLA